MSATNGIPVSASQIATLREQTGAGIMECKKALEEARGDMSKAKEILKDRGIAVAAKLGGRSATDGLIGSYIHAGGKLGVLVELSCETDFVARNEEFQELLRELCFQIAAMGPRWISRDQVPQDVLDAKRKEFEKEAIEEKKPAAIAPKIAEGKLDKYLSDFCLLDQVYVRESSGKVKIKDLFTKAIGSLKENIVLRRFVRFQVGGE